MSQLSEEQLLATADDWHAFLSLNEVPANRYMDCFNVFARGERQNKFTVYDMREAWIRIGNKAREVYIPTSEEDAMCGGCSGSGWANKEFVQSEASGQREWQLLRGGGVRPCSCNKGRRFDRSYKKGVEDNAKLRADVMPAANMRGEKMSAEGIKAEIEKLKKKMSWD